MSQYQFYIENVISFTSKMLSLASTNHELLNFDNNKSTGFYVLGIQPLSYSEYLYQIFRTSRPFLPFFIQSELCGYDLLPGRDVTRVEVERAVFVMAKMWDFVC